MNPTTTRILHEWREPYLTWMERTVSYMNGENRILHEWRVIFSMHERHICAQSSVRVMDLIGWTLLAVTRPVSFPYSRAPVYGAVYMLWPSRKHLRLKILIFSGSWETIIFILCYGQGQEVNHTFFVIDKINAHRTYNLPYSAP
jgi:hypothetical protein